MIPHFDVSFIPLHYRLRWVLGHFLSQKMYKIKVLFLNEKRSICKSKPSLAVETRSLSVQRWSLSGKMAFQIGGMISHEKMALSQAKRSLEVDK